MLPGPTELALILLIILIVFGAGKLPQVMRSLGEGVKMFREAQNTTDEDATVRDVTPARKEITAKAVDADAVEVESTSKASAS